MIVTGVIALFCAKWWALPLLITSTIYHFISVKKIKWVYIEVYDEDGFPGICKAPADGYDVAYTIMVINIIILVISIIFSLSALFHYIL
jgi:hypothetical protein